MKAARPVSSRQKTFKNLCLDNVAYILPVLKFLNKIYEHCRASILYLLARNFSSAVMQCV